MRATRPTLLMVLASLTLSAAAVPVATAAQAAPAGCSSILGNATVGGPASAVAWRAGLEIRTAVYSRLPGNKLRPTRWVSPSDAPWLLVVGRARAAADRCWIRVRLPWRPNNAAGWLNGADVLLRQTPWRIAISTSHRTLTLSKAGATVRTLPAVVGKPSTPTPHGLFAIAWAIPWHPNDFLGSWVLTLSAHSNVLRAFDGGDGTVGIHGRGATSLLDPLGSALSHGCIRLANRSIDWLVHTVGRDQLPGTPVQVK
jgi:lipoprotein-anchoring transpeptidase ErfK/SrfK